MGQTPPNTGLLGLKCYTNEINAISEACAGELLYQACVVVKKERYSCWLVSVWNIDFSW
jgi:hypothetical protein